jgi:predicted phage replisome organizer
MCLAGQINDHGQVYFTEEIPYTDETLATEFDLPIQTVRLALEVFERFGMIEIVDDILRLSSWERYQNVEKLDKYREYQRNYHREYREKQKALKAPETEDDVNLRKCLRKHDVNPIEEEKKEDEEQDKERRQDTPYQAVVSLFNQVCVSFPQVRSLSDARRKAIRARLNSFSLEDIETVFRKAEASDFLKGKNNRNWQATFDWLLKDSNFSKVLDGNYDNKATKSTAAENLDSYYDMVQQWADGE